MSRRRYHMIIPADDEWDKPLHKDACLLHNHLLHGLLHCNGFGHLLCINGHDGGSKFVSGHQFMDLWDRLCTSLQVRAVTVVDTSRKKSIDLRLLLGVAHGTPWFARWGYRFRMGSFGVTEDVYAEAIDRLASLPLDALACLSWDASRIIAVYRRLRWCDPCESFTRLATVRDLLRYLLVLKHRPGAATNAPSPVLPLAPLRRPPVKRVAGVEKRKRKRCRDFESVSAELASRWPARRLRVAAEVIADALLEHGRMTRQEVRDAARLTIGDTGLLDFVLKSLGNCVVGRYVVRRTSNPATRVLEFHLEEIMRAGEDAAAEVMEQEEEENFELNAAAPLEIAQIERELGMVCQALVAARSEEVQAVLNGKHWLKSWGLVDDRDDRLRFLCMWAPSEREMEELTRPQAPPEVVVVEVHASVGDLRMEAERAMRETYCMMEGFRLARLDGVDGEEWDPVMVSGAESGSVVVMSGEGVDMSTELRYEGGSDSWAVRCACGARDDDGERMVACDGCDAWHHTVCIGISDDQPVPPLFLCSRCGTSILGTAASAQLTF